MAGDRERWNAKFQAGEAQGKEPDALLIESCAGLPGGRALDLAGGAGRHAIWLAQRGWEVVLSDIADEGLAIAARRAVDAGVDLTIRHESAAATVAWAGEGQRFDLVVIFWFLLREHFAALPGLLAPGGLLVYKTFTAEHPRFSEGHSLRFALEPGELKTAFPSLEAILYRETDGVAELVARAW